MNRYLKRILCLTISIVICSAFFVSCAGENADDNALKLTREDIENGFAELGELAGELTIDGDDSDIDGFKYVESEINAEKLVDKDFTREAIEVIRIDSMQATYSQIEVGRAFIAVMIIYNILNERDFDDVLPDEFVDEAISILCDGREAEYNGWTISTTIDSSYDTITFNVTK